MAASTPFHPHEIQMQTRVGVAEAVHRQGQRMVRDHMPEQHRSFFEALPFVVAGWVDSSGAPWASLLSAASGLVRSPTARQLVLRPDLHPEDPVNAVEDGARVGLLGLQLETRRRNRANGRLRRVGDAFHLDVEQSFGNCPQYIHTRELRPLERPHPVARTLERLDDPARAWVEGADHFFVASYMPGDGAHFGSDASFRGGRPGFVHVDAQGNLTVPDFLGNFHFNTIGNFLGYPRAGLSFVDLQSGAVMMMTGRVEVLHDDPVLRAFRGAERGWRFAPERILELQGSLPFALEGGEASPNAGSTGTWEQARAEHAAAELRDQWRPHRVVRATAEGGRVRSLVFSPSDGGAVVPFLPGQHVTVRTEVGTRVYSLSSAPHEPELRISVQREGTVSSALHQLEPGAQIELRGPSGRFALDVRGKSPVLLLGAGVGVTPLLSMLKQLAWQGARARGTRSTVLLHAARSHQERALFEEARAIAARDPNMQAWSVLSQPSAPLEPDERAGRIDAELLARFLEPHTEVYLCGPPAFMQAMYEALLQLGVADARIHAESFGPSALRRDGETGVATAQAATLELEGRRLDWRAEQGSLLEWADAHEMALPSACRKGDCGTCRVRVLEGELVHRVAPGVSLGEAEALACQAMPAPSMEGRLVRIGMVEP